MKLWLLRPIDPKMGWDPWYDKCFGFVVRAETEHDARIMVKDETGDEGHAAWMNEKLSTCQPISEEGSAEIIIRDFARA